MEHGGNLVEDPEGSTTKARCAWCGAWLGGGVTPGTDAPVSHGICQDHRSVEHTGATVDGSHPFRKRATVREGMVMLHPWASAIQARVSRR